MKFHSEFSARCPFVCNIHLFLLLHHFLLWVNTWLTLFNFFLIKIFIERQFVPLQLGTSGASAAAASSCSSSAGSALKLVWTRDYLSHRQDALSVLSLISLINGHSFAHRSGPGHSTRPLRVKDRNRGTEEEKRKVLTGTNRNSLLAVVEQLFCLPPLAVTVIAV